MSIIRHKMCKVCGKAQGNRAKQCKQCGSEFPKASYIAKKLTDETLRKLHIELDEIRNRNFKRDEK